MEDLLLTPEQELQMEQNGAPESAPEVQMEYDPVGNISEDDGRDKGQEEETEISETHDEEWQPDYKFKVLDKEHEFDEFVRPIIKDKETYSKVKDLYEKAYGIDHVKAKKQMLEDENRRLSEIERNYQLQNETMGYMGNLIKNKDYHTLFKDLNIPKQEVMRYAIEQANYQSLSPEEKQIYDSNYESREKLLHLEMQNQKMQQQLNEQVTQSHYGKLEGYLNSPEIAPLAQDYDARIGTPGAFQQEVIRQGRLVHYETGKNISVQEAARNAVKTLFGPQALDPEYVNQKYQQRPQQTSNSAPKVQAGGKPVIPNFKSGGASPARRTISSIADIQRAAAALHN